MRLLTRLVLSGAAAVTAWLLTGVVTIRAIDDPTRVGLLPGVHIPLIVFGVLLALSGAVRHPSRAGGVVGLACLASLPWWPVTWPPAALLLTGPLGWAWYLACLACVIEMPTGGWWWWRARAVLAEPSRAPRLAALVAALLLTAAAVTLAPRHPDGDEPDYLIIAQSLLLDGDLQIENNHQRFDYASYHDGVLPPSYLQRGRTGAIYPIHAPGLPVLLLPGLAVAGYPGAVATVILIAALGVGLLWHLAHALTGSAPAAWFGTVAAAGAAPWLLHACVIFPDAPAAVFALVALWTLVEPSRFAGARLVLPALALVWLPWMHTRYAVIAAGLGAAVAVRIWRKPSRTRRDLVWLMTPAVLGALAWFGFFWVIYGTPNPAAPYGTYTQTAWRQVPTGLVGLLFDQQFGLLATAPVLALAVCGAVAGWTRERPHADAADRGRTARWVIVALATTALAYLVLTASYRMWWGGLSAPARFLAPLVLPAGLLLALAWQTVRSRASRGAALILLGVSLGLTGAMVAVDHGRLAYNERDGVAQWTDWASRLVDLSAALPAAHRDGPLLVARDAAIWTLLGVAAWGLLRAAERRHVLSRAAGLGGALAVALVAPTAVWAARGVDPYHPLRAQIDWLIADAAVQDARPLLLTPSADSQPRRRFELDLAGGPARARDPFTALALDRLPAGRYRLFAAGLASGTRLGVAVGGGRATAFIAEADVRQGRAVAEVLLPMPVDRLVVRSSARVTPDAGRVWLRADEMYGAPLRHEDPWDVAMATRAERRGDVRLFFQEDGVFPETDGLWLAADAAGVIGITGPARRPLTAHVTAGARPIVLHTEVGPRRDTLRLDAGQSAALDLGRLPGRGTQQLRFRVEGGFRPALVSASDDGRALGAWLTIAPASE